MKARFASAVLLGFVLVAAAACSGSDGLTTAQEEELQDRLAAAEAAEAEAERLRQAQAAAAAEAERLRQAEEEARKQAEADAAEAERLRQEEEAAREAAEAAAAEAERLRQEEEAARIAAEEEAAAAEAERLRQAAAAAEAERQRQAAAAAEAERQRQAAAAAEAERRLQEQLTEARQAEVRARATLLAPELDGPGAGSATVEWTRGNTLTFRPVGTLDRGSAAPSVPGGWQSASFTGHSGTGNALINNTVYLYTNIQAPSSRAFWKVHNVEVAAAAAGDLNSETNADDPTPTGAARVVRVGSSLDYEDGATYDIAVSGTYDGVSGTYTCTTDCVIADDGDDVTGITAADFDADDWVVLADGERSFVTGTWGFKPGSITSRVKAEDQADQDDAFLYFGAWSSIPDTITGTYDFRYIAGGGPDQGEDFSTKFATLMGPATFRGGAVGRYVTQGQVGGQIAKIGTFTATATLNAHFENATDEGTLSGSITDFREDGSPLTGWRVTLGSTNDVGMASDISGTSANGSTVANIGIGGLSLGGSWSATFYGSGNEELADRTKYPTAQYPVVDLAGVVGWFDATGPGSGTDPNDVAIAGAFGATPQ